MALKEILAKFGFEVDDRNLKKANKQTEDSAKKMEGFAKKLVGVFAAQEIVGGIKSYITEMIGLEGQITDTSEALGVSRTGFQEWSYVASRGGASTEDVAAAFRVLQKNAVDGGKAFSDLGIKAKGVDGQIRPVEDLMNDVAEGLARVENPAERTKLAMDLLGKGGTKLLPILSKGGEEIEALRKRFKELGGGLSEEALDGIGGVADALDDVELASKSLRGGLFLVLAPALKWITNIFASVVAYFNKGADASTRLKSALVILGAAGAAAGLKMLAPYIPLLVLLGGLYLLVQDFWTFLEGGESATGKIIEWLFGKGSAEKVRQDLIKIKADLKEASEYHAAGYTFSDWMNDELDRARRAMNDWVRSVARSFGTDVSGMWTMLGDSAAMGFADALLGGIPSMIKMFVDNLRQMVTGAGEALSTLYTLGSDAASDLVQGLVDGITSGVKKVERAMVDLVTGGVETPMNTKLKRASPAKLTREAGQDTTEGFRLGLFDGLDSVAAMSQHIAGISAAGLSVPAGVTNTRNISAPISNQNSIVIHGAANPQATGSAVAGSLARWGFDDRNRLMAILDTQ